MGQKSTRYRQNAIHENSVQKIKERLQGGLRTIQESRSVNSELTHDDTRSNQGRKYEKHETSWRREPFRHVSHSFRGQLHILYEFPFSRSGQMFCRLLHSPP